MKDLLVEKAKTCEPFRNCLLTSQDKILAESTRNLRWGTGLSKWVTENTKHSFWHGQNLLGVMLMDVTGMLLTSQEDFPSSQEESDAPVKSTLDPEHISED